MAQIPEDVKNQILAARQALESSYANVSKPILEYSGGLQRSGTGGSFLGSYGAMQQAAGQQQKSKQEIGASSQVFEQSVATQVPEYGKQELVQKEYDSAIKIVNQNIENYQKQINQIDKRLLDVGQDRNMSGSKLVNSSTLKNATKQELNKIKQEYKEKYKQNLSS